MKKILIIFSLVALVAGSNVFADDSSPKELDQLSHYSEEQAMSSHLFPGIKPEASLSAGYRLVNTKGSEKAAEYEYLHDSIMFAGDVRMFAYPHRLHLDMDFMNRKDFFGDGSYTYKDLVLIRGINSTLFHNLETIDLDPFLSGAGVAVRDKGEKYGVKAGMNNFHLKLKAPDFPFHFYVNGRLMTKDGSLQQRSLQGAAWFNNPTRTSQSRDVDWETKSVVVGANSHLGPIEIDVSHGEKRFDSGGDKVLFDMYTQAGFGPPPGTRAAGTYPHNLIPDIESSTNTIKLHTSYTGRIVASATLTKTDVDNEDSGAGSDYLVGAGEVMWMPSTKLTFFLKYRHKEADIDNPKTVTITDRGNPVNSYTYEVRPSISSTSDRASISARYRPFSQVALRADYTYNDVRRNDNEAWEIPGSTQENTFSVSASTRIIRTLRLKAQYTHKDINDPAYNIDPDTSDEGKISISWIPLPRLNTLASYNITKEERDHLHYLNTEDAENREVLREMLLGSVTVLVMHDISLTAHYAYMHNKIEQDIVYQDDLGSPFIDPDIPYNDTAHSYGIDVQYLPQNNLSLNAGVTQTVSKAKFSPNSAELLEPVSVASFSRMKSTETTYSVSGEYTFKNGLSSGVRYRYNDFRDDLGNPYDDIKNGEAHIILLTLSKKW